jgi:hypothetical protein
LSVSYYQSFGPSGANYFKILFPAKTPGTYLLSNKNTGVYTWFTTTYSTDSSHTGMVTLIQLDTINHITSGTFWFACEEQSPILNGGSTTVKNGYFTYMKW